MTETVISDQCLRLLAQLEDWRSRMDLACRLTVEDKKIFCRRLDEIKHMLISQEREIARLRERVDG